MRLPGPLKEDVDRDAAGDAVVALQPSGMKREVALDHVVRGHHRGVAAGAGELRVDRPATEQSRQTVGRRKRADLDRADRARASSPMPVRP